MQVPNPCPRPGKDRIFDQKKRAESAQSKPEKRGRTLQDNERIKFFEFVQIVACRDSKINRVIGQ